MEATTTRRPRPATPDRWQSALKRALLAGVQVRQLAGSGQWIATSASDSRAAYELDVAGGFVRACTCAAGEHGDAVCLHRAAFYHAAGMLDLDEGPCAACGGAGWVRKASALFGSTYRVDCRACGGRGVTRSPGLRPAA